MSTTGVLVSGRRRRRRLTAASLARFARVARDPQSYRNLLYLAIALPLGIAYVTILVAGLSIGAGLAVIVIGLALLLATLFALRAMAAVERTLARRLLRIAIHPPLEGGIHANWRQRVQLWLRDPVTWKSLVFLLGKLPMGIVAFAAITLLGLTSVVLALRARARRDHADHLLRLGDRQPGRGDRRRARRRRAVADAACTSSTASRWLYGVCARVMLGPSSVELRERVEGLKDASARILAAADDERRRIERDLHDGAQQRLVALNVLLGVVETKLEKDPAAAAPLVARARVEATEAVKELRELARGIHPALLADRGLIAALEALAARAPFKVRDLRRARPPAPARRRGHRLLHHRRGAHQRRQVRRRRGDRARSSCSRTAAACG